MSGYAATWGVFVIGDDIDGPVHAAQIARRMADEHFRSLWGVEDVDTGETVTVDLSTGKIVPIGENADESD